MNPGLLLIVALALTSCGQATVASQRDLALWVKPTSVVINEETSLRLDLELENTSGRDLKLFLPANRNIGGAVGVLRRDGIKYEPVIHGKVKRKNLPKGTYFTLAPGGRVTGWIDLKYYAIKAGPILKQSGQHELLVFIVQRGMKDSWSGVVLSQPITLVVLDGNSNWRAVNAWGAHDTGDQS